MREFASGCSLAYWLVGLLRKRRPTYLRSDMVIDDHDNPMRSAPMAEADWKRLIRQIREGFVVPVLGSQLLSDEQGSSTVQRDVAERLLKLHDIPETAWPEMRPFRELNAAVSWLRGKAKVKAQTLYVDVSEIYSDLANDSAPLPKPIRQLAEITDFRLFVSMTSDPLLAAALKGLRHTREIVHAPKLPSDEWQDMPASASAGPDGDAWVLYMFGKARPAPVYAIHDEDVLEYAHNIMARGSNVPVNFLRALQDRNLLLLGCGLPDWLGRFFLRLTNKDRLSEKSRHEWLVEALRGGQVDDELTTFLNNFSEDTEFVQSQSPAAFVDELHRRWTSGGIGTPPTGPRLTRSCPVFFVSYSRGTDAPRAVRVVEALRQLGCTEDDIWFDRSNIEVGDSFARDISNGIESCRYFLVLLSHQAMQREQAFVFREWRAADKIAESMNRRFIVPLVIDHEYEPSSYGRDIVDWRHLQFGHAPDGVLDDSSLSLLKQLLRDARNPTRI
ncbi:toll/interleukin-1 receptor domain-containing protein [Paraburkholderia sp. BR10882]|uniref:toll/interleukin-1 receptor domain-containing protein n=1 Tax=unclassified Paraburkholderia TaxID=2615204 RepID=UPI0034CE49AE